MSQYRIDRTTQAVVPAKWSQQSVRVGDAPSDRDTRTNTFSPIMTTEMTYGNRYECGNNRFSLVEQAPSVIAVESVALEADTVSEVTGLLA